MPADLQPITSFASGSVGDRVFARNQHGPYTRSRTTPIDPNSVRQQRVRAHWSKVVNAWADFLTPTQRRSWADYAANIPTYPAPPRVNNLSGQQAFIRANVPRQTAGMTIIQDAPTTYRNTLVAPTSVSTFIVPGVLTLRFDNKDEWAADPFSALIVYLGDEQPPGVNFFKGPFRRSTIVRGLVGPPPTSPRTIFDPWMAATSANRWQRTRVVLADGRLSPPVIRHFAGLA